MNPTPQTLAEHAAFVRALARSLVSDPHAAEDVVQDTWLASLERPPGHGANPRAWLARIVERFAWRRGRTSERRRRRETAAARPERLEAVDEVLARAEMLRRVTDAVLALEEPYQSTVLLRFYEGLEARAIAERTGAPVATVRSRLQRALANLREQLDREHGGDRRAWSLGLVSFLGRDRAADIAGGGAGGAAGASPALGASVGVATTTWTAKLVLGTAAAAIVGVLLWRGTSRGESAAGEAVVQRDEVLSRLDATGERWSQAVADPAPSAQRLAVAPIRVDPPAAHGALALRVTWARDGRPAAGEELSFLAWSHDSGDRARHGLTDQAGRLLLDRLLPGRISIESSHGADGSAEIAAGETKSLELEIPRGFTARGKVVDSQGVPVAGARLWLSSWFNRESGFAIEATRRDGTFELVDVPEGRYLGAIADGYAPSHLHLLADYQRADQLGDVELTLTLNGEGGGLAVELTRPDGRAVAGALVSLKGSRPEPLRLGNRSLTHRPTFSAWTDDDGRASIEGLPPGQAEVAIHAAGTGLWKGLAGIEPGRRTALSIQLQQEGVVVGTVRTARGEPAAGVKVSLNSEHDPLRPSTTSDENGRYELRGLPFGYLRLKAYAEGLGSSVSYQDVELGSAATWDPVLSTGRVLHGQVVDSEGVPLAGWTVRALIGPRSWRVQAETDARGVFRFVDVMAEPLVLELFRDVRNEALPRLRQNVAAEEDELLLRVERAVLRDATLSGRFLDPRGEPIARARVALWTTGASSAPNFETDSYGDLRVERLPPGIYELTAKFPAEPPLFLGSIELAPGEVHDIGTIALEAPGTLRLTVNGRSAAQGSEYDMLSFSQLDDRGHVRWAASCEQAEAEVGFVLQPGRYVLEARGNEGVANERVTFELASGANHGLDLVPRAGRAVLAGAEVPAGSPIPNWVRTTVRDAAGDLLAESTSSAASERRYTYFSRLVPGTYELEAEASDGRRAREFFVVELGGGPEPVELYVPLR